MEFIIMILVVLGGMFFVGLGGLIFSKEDRKFYLTILLIPVVILVIGFGTCVAMLS